MIYSIQELVFANRQGNYHQVFLILLENGQEWVVDITGIQFGIDWPLMVCLNDYAEYMIGPGPHAFLEVFPLGFHADWAARWRLSWAMMTYVANGAVGVF